jgi:DNA-binding LacI/PurR family transcriptional regulator
MHDDETAHPDRVTSRGIARKLRLSQSTVSRVLSGSKDYQYSEETRKRIQAKAEQMGYRPHAVAQSLRQGRTRVIGFCSRHGRLDARNVFLAEIIGSLQRDCSDHGEFLMLQSFAAETSDDVEYGELLSGRIDGLILHGNDDDPLVRRLSGSSLPVVAVAGRVTGMPAVLCDDFGGMGLAVRHLAERGHPRIGFTHGGRRLASVRDRIEGYLAAMADLGLEPHLIEVEYEEATPALAAIRSATCPLTAVCCWNDVTALVLLEACVTANVLVPADLAVMGFDGLLDTRLVGQHLTTISAHWPEVTHRALDLLRMRMGGYETPDETIIDVSVHVGLTA